MRPDRHARALRAVLAGLAATAGGATYLAARLSGGWQGYDLPGEHPLTGRSAPDLELSDGTRLAEHLHSGRALLLDLTGTAAGDPRLRAAAAGYAGRLTVHSATAEATAARAILVRPDGYVAWATDGSAADLPERLAVWLGEAYLCAITAA